MNATISNNGLLPFTPPASGSGSGSTATAGASASSAGASSKVGDEVQLTDSARALQEAARPDDGAVVDHKRVDQIRQALADGSYTINPARIAEQILALDQQISGTDKA
ncbi:MAG TPA: flagellar biosynthesis anti-sigma factor FlgM [Rhodanobacter sp.]|jgi:negative regulator of flagellin synthesis FlgM